MIISEEKHFWLSIRRLHLEVMQIAMRSYARFKDEKFLEYAKLFGLAAKEVKEKLKKYEI